MPTPTSPERLPHSGGRPRGGLESHLEPRTLVRRSTLVYGCMAAIGLAIMAFAHHSLPRAFALPATGVEAARLFAIGALGAAVLLVASYFFEDWFPTYRSLKAFVTRLIGQLSWPAALYLALATSLGEEILFRGALQPYAGLVVTSVLFGLLHMSRETGISAWSVWAAGCGLLLGWMFQETGSLLPPILAHCGINAVSMLSMRRAYRGLTSHLKAEPSLASARAGRGGAPEGDEPPTSEREESAGRDA
jgi:membrane protease YdiL (CAAX protease family)